MALVLFAVLKTHTRLVPTTLDSADKEYFHHHRRSHWTALHGATSSDSRFDSVK